ncbi:unnamed protein product [Boreogadus saida]
MPSDPKEPLSERPLYDTGSEFHGKTQTNGGGLRGVLSQLPGWIQRSPLNVDQGEAGRRPRRVRGLLPACQGPVSLPRQSPPSGDGASGTAWKSIIPPLPSHPGLIGGGAGPVIPYTAPDRRRGGARHPLHSA